MGNDDYSGNYYMGMSFPFYGSTYSYIYIGSNGLIGFYSSSLSDSYNQYLPDYNYPNYLIALLWSDLNPDNTDITYFHTYEVCPHSHDDGACFVVQYDDYRDINGSLAGTFEAILFETGNIIIQYQEVSNDAANSSTVGIEQYGYGLTYAYNGGEITDTLGIPSDELAILFDYPNLAWQPEEETQYGEKGDTLQYQVVLQNELGISDIFELSLSFDYGTEWDYRLYDDNGDEITDFYTVTLEHGESFMVGVEIDIPADAEEDSYTVLQLHAYGQNSDEHAYSDLSAALKRKPTVNVTKDADLYLEGDTTINATVELVLKDSDGITKATAIATSNSNGYFYLDAGNWDCGDVSCYSLAYDTGDVLSAHVPAIDMSTTLTIPELSGSIDRLADTVSGLASANMSLPSDPENPQPPYLQLSVHGLDVHTPDSSRQEDKFVATDENGQYSTDFSYTYTDESGEDAIATLDLWSNSGGTIRYYDDDGNQVYYDYRANYMEVRSNSSYAFGHVESNTTVTVTVMSGDVVRGDYNTESDSDGYFNGSLDDIYGNSVTVEPGDIVEVATVGLVMSMTIPELTAIADAATNKVTGIAPPNLVSTGLITEDEVILPNLYVYNSNNDEYTYSSTDEDGMYTVDSIGNINSGDEFFIRYYNEIGDIVYLFARAPIVVVRGSEGKYKADNYVGGIAPMDGEITTIRLKRDGQLLATEYTADQYFGVYLQDIYGNPVMVEGSDLVEVKFSDIAIVTITVPNFDDVFSNVTDDEVTGNTDASVMTNLMPYTATYGMTKTLTIWANTDYDNTNYYYNPLKMVSPDNLGNFTADNPFYYYEYGQNPYTDTYDYGYFWFTSTLDINPGDVGHLRYINNEGHYVYDNFTTEADDPIIRVRGGLYYNGYGTESYVEVYVPTCSLGSITLKSGTDVKATIANAQACNTYIGYFVNTYGDHIDIEAGDTVEATFNGKTSVVTVPDIEVTVDPENDIISGTATVTVINEGTAGLIYNEPITNALTIWPVSLHDYASEPFTNVFPSAVDGTFNITNPYGYYYDDWQTTDVNIQFGDVGHLLYFDDDGNRVYYMFEAAEESIETGPATLNLRGDYNGYEGDNYVGITAPVYGEHDLLITLIDGNGNLKDEFISSDYSWNYVAIYLDENIEAGDTVQAVLDGFTTTITLPTFDVYSDHENNELHGSADVTVVTTTVYATRTLALWPYATYRDSYGKHVIPDDNDVFTATNPFYYYADSNNNQVDLNWNEGAHGHLRYIDIDNNYIYDDFYAYYDESKLTIEKNGQFVEGVLTVNDVPVTVTIKHSDTIKAVAYAEANAGSYFNINEFYDNIGTPIFIEEGDVVIVETDESISVTVPSLSGWADVDTEMVMGYGLTNTLLNVTANGASKSALTDENGEFSVDFMGFVDIRPGDVINVEYLNPDNHTIYIEFKAGPQVETIIHDYRALGYAPQIDSRVMATLLDNEGNIKGTDTDHTGADNAFNIFFIDETGQNRTVQGGDSIIFEFTSSMTNTTVLTLEVNDLTVEVNATDDTLSGTGPSDELLGVSIGAFDETVTPDENGNWSADASATAEDITAGEQAYVKYINPEFNVIHVFGTEPIVYVRGSGSDRWDYVADNYLVGFTAAYAKVDLILNRADSEVVNLQTRANFNGYYAFLLKDIFENPVDILGNDELLIQSTDDIAMTVPRFEATFNIETDVISGTAPADVVFELYDDNEDYTVESDDDGFFEVEFNDIDTEVYLRYQNDMGHWIHQKFMEAQPDSAKLKARWTTCYDEDERFGQGVLFNGVAGNVGIPDTNAIANLKREGNVIATSYSIVDTYGEFRAIFADQNDNPIGLENGDIVDVIAGTTVTNTVSMTVADLTANINREAGTLYGTAPTNGSPYIYIEGCNMSSVEIGHDGRWVADCDLSPGRTGYIYYQDAFGHYTYLPWAYPMLSAYVYSNTLYALTESGYPVEARLLDTSGNELAVETANIKTGSSSDPCECYAYSTIIQFVDEDGEPVFIEPYQQIVVKTGDGGNYGSTFSTTVSYITAHANSVNDTVAGKAPVEGRLYVYAGGVYRQPAVQSSEPITRTENDIGTYLADFSGDANLKGGDFVSVNHINENGHAFTLKAPVPILQANLSYDIVNGYGRPNALHSFSLIRGNDVYTSAVLSHHDGFFSAYFMKTVSDTLEVVDIIPDDLIQVSDGAVTNTLVVANIDASVDTVNNTISGHIVGANNEVILAGVVVTPGDNPDIGSRTTDADSSFTIDYSGIHNLTEYSYAYILYINEDGNGTFYTSPLPETIIPIPIEDVYDILSSVGASVFMDIYGVANEGDISPPLIYWHRNTTNNVRTSSPYMSDRVSDIHNETGGSLVFAASGGDLILTDPSGEETTYEQNEATGNATTIIPRAELGIWQARVSLNKEGQYALAVGSVPTYDVTLNADVTELADYVGNTVTYTIHITNSGNVTDTFNINITGSNWETNRKPSSVLLGVGEGSIVEIGITIPDSASQDELDTATVEAYSIHDRQAVATVELKTRAIMPVYSFDLSSDRTTMQGFVGSSVDYNVSITNTGNITDSYTIDASGNDWNTTLVGAEGTLMLPIAIGPLGINENLAFKINITIPETANEDDIDVATVKITSAGDATVSVTSIFSTTALSKASTIYLPIVIKQRQLVGGSKLALTTDNRVSSRLTSLELALLRLK